MALSDWDRLTSLAVAGACCLTIWHYRKKIRESSPHADLPLPPGPKPLPLLGNARDLPESHVWLTYTRWKEIYGERLISGYRLITRLNWSSNTR
jgi:hypothetical protein